MDQKLMFSDMLNKDIYFLNFLSTDILHIDIFLSKFFHSTVALFRGVFSLPYNKQQIQHIVAKCYSLW